MTDDDRVRCVECRNYTGTTCRQWRAADLLTAIVGPALADMPQRCPAYVGVNVEVKVAACGRP